MHEVEPLQSGTRFAVPTFFTTQPIPEDTEMPTDDVALAKAMWDGLLAPESVPDFLAFMLRWHHMLAEEP